MTLVYYGFIYAFCGFCALCKTCKSDPNVGTYKKSGNSHQDISAIKVKVSVNLQVPAAEVHVRESLDELLSWLTCDLRHRIGYKHTQYLIEMLINKISDLLDVHTGLMSIKITQLENTKGKSRGK